MTTKVLEIRDRGTCIPALAIRLDTDDPREAALLAHAGYGQTPDDHRGYVLLLKLTDHHYDPYGHGPARTMGVAHQHLIEHFDEVSEGEVVCVEYLLGERDTPKVSDVVLQ